MNGDHSSFRGGRGGRAFLMAACGLALLHPHPARAQSQATLSLPSSTLAAMSSEKGAAWSQVRDGGMILGVRGEGGYYLSIVSLTVKDGRVVDQWNAPTRLRARPGTSKLPGVQFLPEAPFPANSRYRSGDRLQATGPISASDARRAISSRDASVFLDPRSASHATGLLVVALPLCSSSDRACQDSGTNPLFMAIDPVIH
jgi:hypothetical protein